MTCRARGTAYDRSFRILFVEGSIAVRSDADLIRLFLSAHGEAAEAAFEALIARHGPMVLGVCRRILGDEHAAQDAFQTVFLILARKARSVQVDDSLGRWLHGVTRRVARRAKVMGRREIPAPVAPKDRDDDPMAEAVRAEARHLVGLEVARLPRKFREAVDLFHIDGLTHDETAEALGLPVGTVRSRLSRARDLLRSRLVRRGLAPGALASWLGSRPAAAGVPGALLETTLRNAVGGASAAISPTVLALVEHTIRSLSMMKVIAAGAALVALGCLTTGAAMLVRAGDEPSKTSEPAKAMVTAREPARPASLEEQFRRIVAEFDEARERAGRAESEGKTEFERWKIRVKESPEESDYARRIIDLAAAHPREKASRDALIWVLDKPYRADANAYGDEFSRAVNLLVKYHADDPEVARVGLDLNNVLSRRRDAFLEGIYANAEGREARGLARLALAKYLEKKAEFVRAYRAQTGRSLQSSWTYDDQGKLAERTTPLDNEAEGYRVHTRMLDPDFVRGESERLYEEVIADYADVPYIPTYYRSLERKVRETPSATIADPKKKQEMIDVERYFATVKLSTLGQVAAGRLDDMRNLSVGKVAPDFEGEGADGKPLKLSDYRGKVVVMVFWFSTCNPCLLAIPPERELAVKMKGRPFTLLGIVTDGRGEAAREVIESEGMTWPNVLVGGEKITDRYHITANPAYVVVDADGLIRAKGLMDAASIAKLAEKLVGEAESKAKSIPRR
jgi:RNA polymerase sigma factor (sigma-70 family)